MFSGVTAHFNQLSAVVSMFTCANLSYNGSAISLATNESSNSFPAATTLAFSGNFHLPATFLSNAIPYAFDCIICDAFVNSSKNSICIFSDSSWHFASNSSNHGGFICTAFPSFSPASPSNNSGSKWLKFSSIKSGSNCFILSLFPHPGFPCKNTDTLLSIALLIISDSPTSSNSKLYGFSFLVVVFVAIVCDCCPIPLD